MYVHAKPMANLAAANRNETISRQAVGPHADLADKVVTDEQVKGMSRLRSIMSASSPTCASSMRRTFPLVNGDWATLQTLIQYATLQWPVILERIAKRKSSDGWTNQGTHHSEPSM
jgi:hypothetical protein